MDKPVTQSVGLRRSNGGNGISAVPYSVNRQTLSYSERLIKQGIVISLRTKLLAIGIFLYWFIEGGTLGILPPKLYFVYRNMRVSDFILYALIIYSFANIKEYRDLYKSKSLLMVKIVLFYILLEFGISAIRYGFNIVEYFFRLKGTWTSFLIFPYLLLLRRNGFMFLVKLVLPVAIVSNVLYILSAISGIPFLPDVSIIKQQLPGGFEVFRVYGGTFYGDMFFLGFVYFWITKKFRIYQLLLAILFLIPHVLAFGRIAWAFLAFVILLMVVMNSLRKHDYKVLFRQAIMLCLVAAASLIAFIKLIPESDYYIDALYARVFQGQNDVKYSEGTYGTRVTLQNNALVKLWLSNDIIIGIGMHPMWVVRPESHEEQIYYGAFSDIYWAGVLAAYGLVGFAMAVAFQLYYIRLAYKLAKKYPKTDLVSFLLVVFLAKLVFDSVVCFSFMFISVGLWGLWSLLNLYAANAVYAYEELKDKPYPGRFNNLKLNGLYNRSSKYKRNGFNGEFGKS